MTAYDLFREVPIRTNLEESAIEKGLCGHCGEYPLLSNLNYWCHRCYTLMHKGDTTITYGLAKDIDQINKGDVKDEYREMPVFQRPVVIE